jgi:hypothetical protein
MRALFIVLVLSAACDNKNNNNMTMPPADMAMPIVLPDLSTVATPDLAPACVTNPMTHIELINACTNADFVDKMPYYPTLAPNGQLPPLP